MTTTAEVPEREGYELPDRSRALSGSGLLDRFNAAGLLNTADVHVAFRVGALLAETDEKVLLAAALAVRALRGGSVLVDLTEVAEASGPEYADLDWPDPGGWAAAVAASPLSGRALQISGSGVYLDRYWREEGQVCDDLLARAALDPPQVDEDALAAALERLLPGDRSAEQRAAAELACRRRTTVLTGGPGTGKTTTVAALVAMLAEQHQLLTGRDLRVALAAPTGKAAARLSEAVTRAVAGFGAEDAQRLTGVTASTLHRLLGRRPGSSTRFKHDRENRLPYDLVVVDETSMVSLTMMARLLEAVRPSTRLVLVGDADQLASVDAGAVLADLVAGLAEDQRTGVATLRHSHRFGSGIGDLATAIRAGEADRVVELLETGDDLEWMRAGEPGDVPAALRQPLLTAALELRRHADDGDGAAALAALEQHRLLCAHREGPAGVRYWNRLVEQWLAEETGDPVWDTWYVGRPVLVTANDYGLGVYNGDVGVTVRTADGLRVVIAGPDGPIDLAPGRLGDVETMHAMTIHKAQGSQAKQVTVLLPDAESRLLTRELLYTAVTRAEDRVRLVGPEETVRGALDRRAVRASGLRDRLRV